MKKLAKIKLFIEFSVFFIVVAIFCFLQNNSIVISNYTHRSRKIPSAFHGYKILHISDLHNKMFGKNQDYLIKKIKASSPDIIVITGDLIDRRRFDLDTAMCFINKAVDIAPIYYVSGNHEAWSGKYDQIKQSLKDAGVLILDDTSLELLKGENSIQLLGLSDPDFLTSNYLDGTNTKKLELQLKQWSNDINYKILLSHRPELFSLYIENNIDLIFSGHAHGGQIRLPFLGGLIAPDQGFFPKYTSGPYKNANSTMFVSRGLGNSIFPFRVFNRPEIVVVTLKSE
ncbi:metallophosphoesterase [Clostridium cadaveris]|uniref:metallophosphoesterase n=1 Tax=Clostridium cadaveris TaxID=1529 RepID=UPI001E589CA2|nr:metallophosphoesterase [Clostridium cadaveris]UFH64542.1 metallophosphoesterase [Clostridium cadaveris]